MASPFSRSLHTLLRLRQSLERQEEMKLALATQRLATAEGRLGSEQESRRREHDAALREMSEGVDGAGLSLAEQQWHSAGARAQRLRGQVGELAQVRATQVEALVGRVRERKVLENLRERRDREARVEQERRSQQGADDAFARRAVQATR